MKLETETRVINKGFIKKRSLTKSVFRYSVSFLFIVFSVMLVIATWSNFQKYRNVEQMSSQAIRVVNELEKKEQQLKSDIQRLESPFGQEAELRKKYGVGKPGEEVYIFIEDSLVSE